jgi:hypothetical protein
MDTMIALWAFHKENIILSFVAGVVFALAYEVTTYCIRKLLK